MNGTPHRQAISTAFWIAGALWVASAIVRLQAAGADLWLDEIWSIRLAQTVSSPLDVVTRIRETNNHPLNTLWLSVAGDTASRLWLRMPSLVFGIAAVAIGGALAARRGRIDAWIAMFLLGSSYLMIDTSAEARGYAPMAACALAGWLALETAEQNRKQARPPSWGWPLLFNATVVLGFLFQLSFALAYAALAGGWVFSRLRQRLEPRAWLREFMGWHALPLAVLVLLYAFWVQHLAIGGDVFPTVRVLARTAMLAVGLDGGTGLMGVGATIATLFFVAGIVVVARDSLERAVVYAIGIALAPAAALAWMEPSFLAPRYFLASVAFFLLLVSEVLGALARSRRAGAVLCTAFLALFGLGNAVLTAPLLAPARDNVNRALAIMQEDNPGAVVDIGSRFAFRDQLLLGYHARKQVPPVSLRFWTAENWPAHGPDWMILTVQSKAEAVPTRVRGPRDNLYTQVAPFEGLRGREPHWYLYRAERRNRPPRAR
ncbi:MAG: hypothetical protein VX574_11065 [Myxococcota bacterium]|nr:hypothetical protein [Myxococcota bacterium]